MEHAKAILTSKTILLALLQLVVGMVAMLNPELAGRLDPAFQNEIATSLVNLFGEVLTVKSLVDVALRVKTTQPVRLPHLRGGPMGAVLLLFLVGGCETVQDTIDKIDTPENRVKGAEALTKAASGSCDAAVGYLKYVGPELEGYNDFVIDLQEDCVKAQELEIVAE